MKKLTAYYYCVMLANGNVENFKAYNKTQIKEYLKSIFIGSPDDVILDPTSIHIKGLVYNDITTFNY